MYIFSCDLIATAVAHYFAAVVEDAAVGYDLKLLLWRSFARFHKFCFVNLS